jgi:hypothetical protein
MELISLVDYLNVFRQKKTSKFGKRITKLAEDANKYKCVLKKQGNFTAFVISSREIAGLMWIGIAKRNPNLDEEDLVIATQVAGSRAIKDLLDFRESCEKAPPSERIVV